MQTLRRPLTSPIWLIAEWPSKPSTQGRRHPVVIVTEALSELRLSSPGWAYKPHSHSTRVKWAEEK